jgi:hypothetical protein
MTEVGKIVHLGGVPGVTTELVEYILKMIQDLDERLTKLEAKEDQ